MLAAALFPVKNSHFYMGEISIFMEKKINLLS